tara:strand:+ start:1195 stop:1647 length:453 start_codon:yes stop_codon:yes gene_type:complete
MNVVDLLTASDKTGKDKMEANPGKRFNRRELDFSADAQEYVVVYPAKDEPTEGYRFWIARAQEPVSYEINKKKKAVVVYYTAKGNTEYLEFEQESPRKIKIHFAMLMGKIDTQSLNQISDTQISISISERNKWSSLAKELDKEEIVSLEV